MLGYVILDDRKTKMQYSFAENLRNRLFMLFQLVACNPEWWMAQYAPVMISALR